MFSRRISGVRPSGHGRRLWNQKRHPKAPLKVLQLGIGFLRGLAPAATVNPPETHERRAQHGE
jgi:hypothetical protein